MRSLRHGNRADVFMFLLTLAVSTAFGIFLSAKRVTDPFLFYDVAFVKSVQYQDHMAIPETGPYATLGFVPGREMLMLQFANMMGVAPEQLQFMPLGTVVVSVTLYVLGLRLLRSPLAASVMTLNVVLNLSHAAILYSVFAYALAFPLFVAFIIAATRFFERRTIFDIACMVLLFVAVHSLHHTLATWMIFFLVGANLTIGHQKRNVPASTPISLIPAHYVSAAFLVIFLIFNRTFYESFLPLIGTETLDGAVQRFLLYFSIDPVALNRSPYFYTRPIAVGLVSALSLGVILLPVAWGAIQDVIHLITHRSSSWLANPALPVMWGILLVGIFDSISYSVRGTISTKSFALIFPLLALLYIQRLGLKRLFYAMLALVAVTTLSKIVIFQRESYVISKETASREVAFSSQWLRTHYSESRFTMLADLNLYGKYLVASVDGDYQPVVQGYALEGYQRVVGEEGAHWSSSPAIVAVDMASVNPTVGFLWKWFDPLQDYLTGIRNNRALNVVYDDGMILFAKPTRE